MIKTKAEMDFEINEAVQRSASHADPEWLAAFLRCLFFACMENQVVTIACVWDVWERLGMQASTANKMAAGAVMRHGAKCGWMDRTDKTEFARTQCNHNQAGTSVWHSRIYDPEFELRDIHSGQREFSF